MTATLIVFLQAVSATCAWACAVFFYRFWRESRDRLFFFFSAAFLLLSICWVLLALIDPIGESRPYAYAIRLVAFLLIIVAMMDKNRNVRS
jgi:hypothetical protein